MKEIYPEKFASEDEIFSRIHPGSRIFIGTGCGEPQHLVRALMQHVDAHPKSYSGAEVWAFGMAPYGVERLQHVFRHNSFFIGDSLRDAVNRGVADYTPVFLSEVPDLFHRRLVPIDVALIQTSPPDRHGFLSLGVSVDIVKAAVESASVVIVQMNSHMPSVHGDGFIPIKDVDYIVPHDEPLLEFHPEADSEIAQRIGKYVSRLIQDGDTIQAGYGGIPNAILANLEGKRHLGVHTELLSDGIVDLMKKGAVDNKKKALNPGKTVASLCMGRKETYEYIDDNPAVELRTIDYTNHPLVISQHHGMTAINSALEVDLTGQATAESIGRLFYSGVGGQTDFVRGALLSPGGKTILALPSTARNESVSRIVPFLSEGAGVTLHRGDTHYVVTEFGIAYLRGKNIRERAMELVYVAHPKFRPWLIEEARKASLIFKDQAFLPGEKGEYPEHLETYRKTKTGLQIFLRPVKISDEPLLKDFFYSFSESSLYHRFHSPRRAIPHDVLQNFVVVDYTKQMAILAIRQREGREEVIGEGRYIIGDGHMAEVALAVRDDDQDRGVGTELFSYLTYLAKKNGLHGFTALVMADNSAALRLIRKMGFDIERTLESGIFELKLMFRKKR